MGFILFVSLAAMEIAFAVFSIVTRSNQTKIRNVVRIAALLIFVLLVCLSVVEWGLRYYTLAAWLLALAVIGSVSMIHSRKETTAYRTARVVGNYSTAI